MRHHLLLFCGLFLIGTWPAFSNPLELDKRTYYLHEPDDIDGEKLPLLVWCHPASGQAKPEFDWWLTSAWIKKNVMLLAPQAKERGWRMKNDAKFVRKLIKKIIADKNIDKKRVYLGGHSSGAIFTYDYGLKYSKDFKLLISACGVLNGRPKKAKKSSADVLIYHSPNDKVFPISYAQKAQSSLEKKGYEVEFIEDKAGHAIGPKLQNAVVKHIKAKADK